MFGGGSTPSLPRSESSPAGVQAATETKSPSPDESTPAASATTPSKKQSDQSAAGDKAEGNGGSSAGRRGASAADADKKRRSSGVGSKASSLLATAKSSLSSFGQGARAASDASAKTPLQKLGKQDPALAVPQGQHNNSAGESLPGPRSTFRVGVWEDRNKKCRRTMEDTHAFLYNFLATPAPTAATSSSAAASTASKSSQRASSEDDDDSPQEMIETDNGYFAIFDGHAGTFAADWCGKKLHVILEDAVRKHPNTPLPELLDMTFTTVDSELEKLPLKNSGCTAAIAVLRWEDRVPSDQSLTGSQAIAPATAAAAADAAPKDGEAKPGDSAPVETVASKLRSAAQRQRVLYTANVGDARIILCRNGKALRLSYDHKGSDANEGRRIANAGGLILNNRVNGVLAVTRALGDTYIKELVTGHPYTTETVIQPDHDEFIIIACDGLWDVCSDQEAVELVRNIQDPVAAAKLLVDHALGRFSTDNLSCMIVRLDKDGVLESQRDNPIGVEGDPPGAVGNVSEVDKIVGATKRGIAEGGVPAVGVSASNSGKGHDPEEKAAGGGSSFKPTAIDGAVPEEELGSAQK